MAKIDARFVLPGQLITDPLGQTGGVLSVQKITVENRFPHLDIGSAVPSVVLKLQRGDDGNTQIPRTLDVGTEVEVVPNPPNLLVNWDEDTLEWVATVDTTGPGRENTRLYLELNDTLLFSGDVDGEADRSVVLRADREAQIRESLATLDTGHPDPENADDDELADWWARRALELAEQIKALLTR